MSFRVAQFNILGRYMAGTMWFHYARDFMPTRIATKKGALDWTQKADLPRYLAWRPEENGPPARFYRFQVLIDEIRQLQADILCLVELDCFDEFRDALRDLGYDAVFQQRPNKSDGCGIFWKREVFAAVAPHRSLVFTKPSQDRIALKQPLLHLATRQKVFAVSTHLHWDQALGHQLSEVEELKIFLSDADDGCIGAAAVLCGDLNATPGSAAYDALRCKLNDAARAGEDASSCYTSTSFTSLKPDVYFFTRPRGCGFESDVREEWHLQEGRSEVLDYIFYDPIALEIESPPIVANLDASALASANLGGAAGMVPEAKMKPRCAYGYWAGGFDFETSPARDLDAHRYDATWRPARSRSILQLGIPNRLHGSDHLPVVCRLRFSKSCTRELEPSGGAIKRRRTDIESSL